MNYPNYSEIQDLREKNDRLVEVLQAAKQQIQDLKAELDEMSKPPAGYGTFLGMYVPDEDGEPWTADVFSSGKKFRVVVAPSIDHDLLTFGCEVLLNDNLTIVEVGDFDPVGEVVELVEWLPDSQRALVSTGADDFSVVVVASEAHYDEYGEDYTPKPGDSLLANLRAGVAYEVIPKTEVESLKLEEVPDVSYEDIGGLGPQIEAIRDAVELPFLHRDLFKKHKLAAPKGVLLYGPPGTGKTLIAKAVANSLANQAESNGRNSKAFFINISGPELLDKYVGESERKIRQVFQQAREKASEDTPVVIFFDELESLFRTRGSGISSDTESTIVPTLLAQLDGLEGLKNVIVIGATNRAEMVDPAVLRPGRLDVKIKVERPDVEGARDIFSKYLTEDLPLDGTAEGLINEVVEVAFDKSEHNKFLEVTYESGSKEVLYFSDFLSGAMINGIVSRAKKSAIKEFLKSGKEGITAGHLVDAVREEFRENEDLPSTTSPDDWARVAGLQGEKIVFIRNLVTKKSEDVEEKKDIQEAKNTGLYL